ncbi:MAG: GNAT family protein [Pseudomonadota bacterium]|nr:GNAT family protein [Pseudomonadota bacterium]
MTPGLAAALNAPLSTARLTLAPLLGAHAAALFPILADPGTQRWISAPKAKSEESMRQRWAGLEGRCSPDGVEAWVAWAVQRRDDGAWLGKIDANVDGALVVTNLGYVFSPAHWGHGYATEAVGAVVDHLIRVGVTELRATVTVGNEASCHVLERLGFERRGVLVGNDVIRGIPHDDHLYVRPGRPGIA